MTTEHIPKKIKLAVVQGLGQDSTKPVLKLLPFNNGNNGQGVDSPIFCTKFLQVQECHETIGVIYENPGDDLLNTTQSSNNTNEYFNALTRTISAPSEQPPAHIFNTPPQKTTSVMRQNTPESYQSMFEKRCLDMTQNSNGNTSDIEADIFGYRGNNLNIPQHHEQYEVAVASKEPALSQENGIISQESIDTMLKNARILVAPPNGFNAVIEEEPVNDDDAYLQNVQPQETDDQFIAPTPKTETLAPIPQTDEIISIGSDSEATEMDEEEIEKLKTGYIEEASVYNDEDSNEDDDEFGSLFYHHINTEEHNKIVKEIMEDKMKNFPKLSCAPFDNLEEEMRNLTGENDDTQPEEPQLQVQTTHEHLVPIIPQQSSEKLSHDQEEPQNILPRSQMNQSQNITNESAGTFSDTQSMKTTTLPASPSCSKTSQAQDKTNIVEYLQRIETRLNAIESRLTKLEEACAFPKTDFSESSDDEVDDNTISIKFPIKNHSGLQILENILKVPKMKTNLEQKFQIFSGINEMDSIDMILQEMLDSSLQESFKYRHTETARRVPFENYVHINKLIFDCIKFHYKLFSSDEYSRLMILILNRATRRSCSSRNSGEKHSRTSSVSSFCHRGSQGHPSPAQQQ